MTSPEPPYYAVIFTTRKSDDLTGYAQMAEHMLDLAYQQPGFIDSLSAQSETGRSVTISYWQSREAIAGWKANTEHQIAQQRGMAQWYDYFRLEVAEVQRAYDWHKPDTTDEFS